MADSQNSAIAINCCRKIVRGISIFYNGLTVTVLLLTLLLWLNILSPCDKELNKFSGNEVAYNALKKQAQEMEARLKRENDYLVVCL